MDLPIMPSAYRHRVSEAQIRHALGNQVRRPVPDQGDLGLLIIIGATAAGAVLEVGVLNAGQHDARIVHAMPARSKYWP